MHTYRYRGFWVNLEDVVGPVDGPHVPGHEVPGLEEGGGSGVIWADSLGHQRVYVASGLGESVTARPAPEGAERLVTIQSSSGRRTCLVDAEADARWLAARGLFPRVGHLGTTRIASRSRGPVVYYTRGLLDLLQALREECSPSHDNMQRVFTGASMPDHRVFNEMFLQYQVLLHDAPSVYSEQAGIVVPVGCPACYHNPFKHFQMDVCFKFWKKVGVVSGWGVSM
jgi:hypothetical protein